MLTKLFSFSRRCNMSQFYPACRGKQMMFNNRIDITTVINYPSIFEI